MQVFNRIAQFFKLPTKKGLILPTMWNCTYAMVHNVLSYKDEFVKYVDEYYSGYNCQAWAHIIYHINPVQKDNFQVHHWA